MGFAGFLFLLLTRALLGGGGRLNAPLMFFEASGKTAAPRPGGGLGHLRHGGGGGGQNDPP